MTETSNLVANARRSIKALSEGFKLGQLGDYGMPDQWCETQLFRLRSWCAVLGVFAPSHVSLDHRLRYNLELQELISRLLQSIFFNVEHG